MDTISLCSVIRDLHHRLEFRSDLFRKNQANDPSAEGGDHSEHTPSESYSIPDFFYLTQMTYDAPLSSADVYSAKLGSAGKVRS
jgi:hypothetical protein